MSQNRAPFGASTTGNDGRSYFESQRAALLGEIGVSLEHTLQAINKLNRSLEGVIAVGNEFGSVEALWSTFETVMGADANQKSEETQRSEDERQEGEGEGDSTIRMKEEYREEGERWKSDSADSRR